MEDELYNNSQVMTMDEEELKAIASMIKKYANELNDIKKNSDVLWEECNHLLGTNITSNINIIKDMNKRKHDNAIDELNNCADRLNTITNIWKETELEVMNSTKSLESVFSDISKKIITTIEQNK